MNGANVMKAIRSFCAHISSRTRTNPKNLPDPGRARLTDQIAHCSCKISGNKRRTAHLQLEVANCNLKFDPWSRGELENEIGSTVYRSLT